jgi:nucleotide-binding universal stress UspA family protein
MPFKTILVHIDASEPCKRRLEAAIRLAVDFRALMVGIYLVAGTDLPPSVAVLLPSDVLDRHLRESVDAQREAEQLFRRASAAGHVATIEWRAPAGAPLDAAIAHGRCADLFVMGQYEPDDPARLFNQELVATTIVSTGRPAMIIPYTGARSTLGENVLVAWDGGREASRAIADALPFLERARKVTVIAVDSGSNAHMVDTHATSRLAAYLHANGVAASISHDDATEISIGDRLLSRAADLGSDLIVMGGYGHARLREFVLGGVTRTMLETMTVPVLMSH